MLGRVIEQLRLPGDVALEHAHNDDLLYGESCIDSVVLVARDELHGHINADTFATIWSRNTGAAVTIVLVDEAGTPTDPIAADYLDEYLVRREPCRTPWGWLSRQYWIWRTRRNQREHEQRAAQHTHAQPSA